MRLAQNGDLHAYASLLVLLTGVTRKYARARAGSVPWIDDVVQETLLACTAHLVPMALVATGIAAATSRSLSRWRISRV